MYVKLYIHVCMTPTLIDNCEIFNDGNVTEGVSMIRDMMRVMLLHKFPKFETIVYNRLTLSYSLLLKHHILI